MSFSFQLENTVISFIDTLCKKYKLPNVEVLNLWKHGDFIVSSELDRVSRGVANALIQDSLIAESNTPSSDSMTQVNLNKMTKAELTELCRKHGVKVTGTKPQLVERLLNPDAEESKAVRRKSSQEKPTPAPASKAPSTKTPASKTPASKPSVLTKLTQVEPLTCRVSVHGNMILPFNNLVFDKVSQAVIGKEESDGSVVELDEEDIELCKLKKIPYELPASLDTQQKEKVSQTDKLLDDESIPEEQTEDEIEDELEEEN